jgi:restriction system protein
MAAAGTPKVPGYHELIWPTLKALKAMGGSASNEELAAKLVEIENIPEDVQAVVHVDNRQPKLFYNLAWAKTYLKRVGALANSQRGVWSLTATGEKMTEKDCINVPALVRKQDAERKKLVGEELPTEEASPLSGPPTEETWKDTALSVLRKMHPDAFERLAQRLLREAGFIKVEVTGRSGDGGIDGLGVLRVNLLSFQVLFQCTRYQETVGAGAVRDFRGAMVGRCDKGVIITTATFSSGAKKEATRDGAPAIDLIDGDQLCELLKQLKLGIEIETVERVAVDPEWFAKI